MIDSNLSSTISHMENTKDLWEDIQKRFFVAMDLVFNK